MILKGTMTYRGQSNPCRALTLNEMVKFNIKFLTL